MKRLLYIIALLLCCINMIYSLNRSELIAVHDIEKEVQTLIQKKSPLWMRQAQKRIDQLEKQYVPRGYDMQKVVSLKQQLKLKIPIVPEINSTKKNITPLHEQKEITQKDIASRNTIEQEEALPKSITAYPIAEKTQKVISVASESPDKVMKEYTERESRTVQEDVLPKSVALTSVAERTGKVIPVVSELPEKTMRDYTERAIHSVQEEALPVEIRQKNKKQLYEKSAEKIIKKLNEFLLVPREKRTDEWKSIVNKYIFALAITDAQKAKEYFEDFYITKPERIETIALPVVHAEYQQSLPTFEQHTSFFTPALDREKKIQELSQRIDSFFALPAQQQNPITNKTINDLIFELSSYDREKAHEYMNQMYVRIGTLPQIPGMAQQPRASIPLPPPLPGTSQKTGGPPVPPPLPGATGLAALPKTGGPKPPLNLSAPKAPAKPAITLGSLRKMDDTTLLELLENHLDALEKHWNEQSNEIVKVKTQHGERTEMVRGVPEVIWNNTLNTIKKVVLEKQLMGETDLIKKINNRITAVRTEKIKKGQTRMVTKEEAIVEDTKEDIERRLKALFAEPKTTEMPWLVNVKSGIKKLNEKDHEAALKYQEKFIELLPKEKSFIKP